jgi:hypothetical protein
VRAAADDRDRGPGEQREVGLSADEQAGRRIVHGAEQRRELRRRTGHEAEAGTREALLVGRRVERAKVRAPARARRRPDQVRAGLRREHREREVAHAASSCGAR